MLGLREEACIGLLLGLSGQNRLPAEPWPLTAACQRLAKVLPDGSPHAGAHLTLRSEDRDHRTRSWVRALGTAGHAQPREEGMRAYWHFSDSWLEGWRAVGESLPRTEVTSWHDAAQVLTTSLSIWEKTLAAAASGSGATDSSTPRTFRHPVE